MRVNRAVPHHGKPLHYRTDGTGRDGYIFQHDGGFVSQDHLNCLALQTRDHSPRFTFARRKYLRPKVGLESTGNNRFVHYVSDGTGRDNYVGRTEGGNATPYDWKETTEHRFLASLRTPKLPAVAFLSRSSTPKEAKPTAPSARGAGRSRRKISPNGSPSTSNRPSRPPSPPTSRATSTRRGNSADAPTPTIDLLILRYLRLCIDIVIA